MLHVHTIPPRENAVVTLKSSWIDVKNDKQTVQKTGNTISEHPSIEPGSLAEHLYNHHSLSSLERLLTDESFELLKRQWTLSDEHCKQQIELAMQYIRND